ncbi:cytochrome P450 81E8-like [Prosopis cineraria]|uniref:cytochrome P450 81E8-like n=1 Tax=Prosopis cineraria TaxID=364024 RepID=UPI00240EC805|nr:cytochrome P450 81E8-like [Prosopis cineraria]
MERTIMEDNLIFYFALCLLILITSKLLLQTRSRFKKLPPSPPSLPILGNLLQLKQPLHSHLHSLSQKYGPIFSLRLGSRFAVVVSSPSAVEECFTKNDIIFANRVPLHKTKYIGYNNTVLVASSYGDHWRNLRRISSLEILSTARINSFLNLRVDETKLLLRKLARQSKNNFAKVELRSMFSDLTFNTIMRMVAGKRYYGDEADLTNVEEAKRFRDAMQEISSFSLGTKDSNLVDFLPLFRWIDYNGYKKRLQRVGKTLDELLQGLIDEHRYKKEGLESTNTLIDHLLISQESEPEYYTDKIIKGLIMVLILAGTDTSAITLEWAMSYLLNYPRVLDKARIELEAQVGEGRLVEEADVTKLSYLKSIISETMRLSPAAPMLVPHMASDDCFVGGYDVPRGTMLLVNAWAIHRDPDLWTDALIFKPERFENEEGEARKLIPFGMGRRACPGAGLAQRTVGLTLASLIQCFDWKRVSDLKIDMRESGGGLMPKAIPLEVQCKARPILSKILSQP